jgi:hypothetical protein
MMVVSSIFAIEKIEPLYLSIYTRGSGSRPQPAIHRASAFHETFLKSYQVCDQHITMTMDRSDEVRDLMKK